ncbi:hypothetical protein ACP275_11G106200 [Erythranthe tilingii]
MSIEEVKIREELEMEIEKNLEEEIKEGIYHFALKLHKFYQHQKEKRLKQYSSCDKPNEQGNFITREKIMSEVNITIKMEGENIIQIKEIKKEDEFGRGNFVPINIIPSNPRHARNVRGKKAPPVARTVKFNWTDSLRSGSNVVKVNPTQPRRDKNRDKVDVKIKKTGLLEVGWKY